MCFPAYKIASKQVCNQLYYSLLNESIKIRDELIHSNDEEFTEL